jgi:flagellar biosynthesis protein FlhG
MSVQLDFRNDAPQDNVIVLKRKLPAPIIWPVAGGKGGTGKSTLTANIGIGLALLGYKVILVDGDLGGADLHLFFDQIAPRRSVGTFLTKEVRSLEDVLLPTPNQNLKLICGGNELVSTANLPFLTKEKLIRHIKALEADYILIDLGAGSAYNTLDFFSLSDTGLLVCTPEPQARVDAYGFIKNTVYRKLRKLFSKNPAVKQVINQFALKSGAKSGRIKDLLDLISQVDRQAHDDIMAELAAYKPKLILNKVRNKRHIEEIKRFSGLVREYLNVDMEYVGYMRSDDKILDAGERRRPVLLHAPKAYASRDLYKILMSGLKVPDKLERFSADHCRKLSQLAKVEAKLW